MGFKGETETIMDHDQNFFKGEYLKNKLLELWLSRIIVVIILKIRINNI